MSTRHSSQSHILIVYLPCHNAWVSYLEFHMLHFCFPHVWWPISWVLKIVFIVICFMWHVAVIVPDFTNSTDVVRNLELVGVIPTWCIQCSCHGNIHTTSKDQCHDLCINLVCLRGQALGSYPLPHSHPAAPTTQFTLRKLTTHPFSLQSELLLERTYYISIY